MGYKNLIVAGDVLYYKRGFSCVSTPIETMVTVGQVNYFRISLIFHQGSKC